MTGKEGEVSEREAERGSSEKGKQMAELTPACADFHGSVEASLFVGMVR